MREDGFSLVEVVFLLMVLTFGVLALAQASTVALHQASIAGRQDARWATVQRWSDSLTVRGHGNVDAGSDTIGDISAVWAVDSIEPDLERLTMALAGGVGAGAWEDTLILHLYR